MYFVKYFNYTRITGSSRGPTPGSDRMDTGGACTPDLMGEKGNDQMFSQILYIQ